MARRKQAAKSNTAAALAKLRAEEAAVVLSELLDKHPELKSEAEGLAAQLISKASIEEVAEEVYLEITGIDLEALNSRAGSHSWGYVEPSEAAAELLTEALDDRVEEMKRALELGLLAPAEVLCAGMVHGLYRARNTNSDGALGWAVDFPAEEAHFLVAEFVQRCSPSTLKAARASLMHVLSERAPEWVEGLQRVAMRSMGSKADLT